MKSATPATKKHQLYLTYYAILGCFVLLQVAYTLYQTSLLVVHGRHQQELETKQAQLLSQKQALQETLATENSLNNFSQTANLNEYHLIAHPIIIDQAQALAAAN